MKNLSSDNPSTMEWNTRIFESLFMLEKKGWYHQSTHYWPCFTNDSTFSLVLCFKVVESAQRQMVEAVEEEGRLV